MVNIFYCWRVNGKWFFLVTSVSHVFFFSFCRLYEVAVFCGAFSSFLTDAAPLLLSIDCVSTLVFSVVFRLRLCRDERVST